MNFDNKEHSKEKIFDAEKSNIYLPMEDKKGNYKITLEERSYRNKTYSTIIQMSKYFPINGQ